jgi:hypothetical protein
MVAAEPSDQVRRDVPVLTIELGRDERERYRAPERNTRSNWSLACRSSKRPSVAITC